MIDKVQEIIDQHMLLKEKVYYPLRLMRVRTYLQEKINDRLKACNEIRSKADAKEYRLLNEDLVLMSQKVKRDYLFYINALYEDTIKHPMLYSHPYTPQVLVSFINLLFEETVQEATQEGYPRDFLIALRSVRLEIQDEIELKDFYAVLGQVISLIRGLAKSISQESRGCIESMFYSYERDLKTGNVSGLGARTQYLLNQFRSIDPEALSGAYSQAVLLKLEMIHLIFDQIIGTEFHGCPPEFAIDVCELKVKVEEAVKKKAVTTSYNKALLIPPLMEQNGISKTIMRFAKAFNEDLVSFFCSPKERVLKIEQIKNSQITPLVHLFTQLLYVLESEIQALTVPSDKFLEILLDRFKQLIGTDDAFFLQPFFCSNSQLKLQTEINRLCAQNELTKISSP